MSRNGSHLSLRKIGFRLHPSKGHFVHKVTPINNSNENEKKNKKVKFGLDHELNWGLSYIMVRPVDNLLRPLRHWHCTDCKIAFNNAQSIKILAKGKLVSNLVRKGFSKIHKVRFGCLLTRLYQVVPITTSHPMISERKQCTFCFMPTMMVCMYLFSFAFAYFDPIYLYPLVVLRKMFLGIRHGIALNYIFAHSCFQSLSTRFLSKLRQAIFHTQDCQQSSPQSGLI